jgi:hypothetical protein
MIIDQLYMHSVVGQYIEILLELFNVVKFLFVECNSLWTWIF